MSRMDTASDIFRQSFRVLREHKTLLAFQLLPLMGLFVIFMFFMAPLIFHDTPAGIWKIFWSPELSLQPSHADLRQEPPFALLATIYMLGTFMTTFVNFAFYSQVIHAMNGGTVSVTRGFALALARLPVLAAWSLLAGTIGVMLRMVEERLPFVGRLTIGLLGMAVSAVTALVIPVMLNEPRARNPIEYARISAGLIKRVWGEGLVGVVSVALVGIAPMIAGMTCLFIGVATHQDWLMGLGVLLLCGIAVLQGSIDGIFRCGLYIYATEGVPPGPFDAATMDRAWTVRANHSRV